MVFDLRFKLMDGLLDIRRDYRLGLALNGFDQPLHALVEIAKLFRHLALRYAEAIMLSLLLIEVIEAVSGDCGLCCQHSPRQGIDRNRK